MTYLSTALGHIKGNHGSVGNTTGEDTTKHAFGVVGGLVHVALLDRGGAHVRLETLNKKETKVIPTDSTKCYVPPRRVSLSAFPIRHSDTIRNIINIFGKAPDAE